MKKQYSTKKALVASALSLVLCCAMLIGTTFAWFTDAVVYGDPAEPPYEDDAVQGAPEENPSDRDQ